MPSLYSRRVFVNRFNLAMSLLTMAFGLAFLFWILFTLFAAGFNALSKDLFTEMTPPPGSKGGLLNAIVVRALMASIATSSEPRSASAGIYLAEYGSRGWLAPCTRFINDILLSALPIIIGLFIYGSTSSRWVISPHGPARSRWR
jgi:phosphate transport system permease protein